MSPTRRMAALAYALTLLSACVDTSAPDNAGPSEEPPDVAAASAIAGVYDFTSSVTQFDPAYGDLTGAMQMFAMTIRSEPGTNRLVGTATNFQDIHLDLRITPWQTLPGLVTGSATATGEVIVELTAEGEQSSYLHAEGVVASPGLIKGQYYTATGTSGTFGAARR